MIAEVEAANGASYDQGTGSSAIRDVTSNPRGLIAYNNLEATSG